MGKIIPLKHPQKQTDVHTEHCCKNCGCKYGDDAPNHRSDYPLDVDCTVKAGVRKQSNPCGKNGVCNGY